VTSSDARARTGEGTAEERQEWWTATGRDELRQLLYWRWDPIGVNHEFPDTHREYDHYADSMRPLLVGDADEDELEAEVIRAVLRAQEAMGFEHKPGAEADRLAVTRAILDWRRASFWLWKDYRRRR
jgi:hypothetical protein